MNKKIFTTLFSLFTCVTGAMLTSCEDYLNEKPKGQNIPETTEDFSQMLNYEYGAHRYDITHASSLIGDRFCSDYYLTNYPLYKANYLWDTSINRAEWNNSDEITYYQNYSAIAISNVVIDYTPDSKGGSDAEKQTIMAYAKALRAMSYYQLANYYANAYKSATASNELCVPIISSSAVNVPYVQGTVQQVYDEMIKDVNEALPYLPDNGRNILLPGKNACYAFLARVYLTMMQYDKAEEYADKALAANSNLFDWTAFYEANRSAFETEGSYNRVSSPMGMDYCENYDFKYGSSSNAGAMTNLPSWRVETVEAGDAKFNSSWKFRDYGSYTQYYGMITGLINYGGLKTVEQHLIKAECLARKNEIASAMNILNKVRKTRILPDVYAPLSASSKAEAISLICRTKWNDLIGSIVPFADMRRLNAEGEYPYTLTRTRDGKQESLSPDSYLWTMVLPLGAIENPGGGKIEYIATK